MLQPFDIVPHVVVTPNIKLFLLQLRNCNFATVMDCNVTIFGARGLPRVLQPTG